MNKILNPFSIPPVYGAPENWGNISGTNCVSGNGEFNDIATIGGLECLFYNISQIIIPIAGLIFFAMLIVGGFKYLTAGGDPKKASSATSTLTRAIIGIIGVILSWLIIKFIQNFTGTNITEFKIPS